MYIFIRFNKRLRGSAPTRLLILLIAAVTLTISFIYGTTDSIFFNASLDLTLTGLGFSALTLYAALGSRESRLPLKRSFAFIARISYTMYLYHIIIIGPVVAVVARLVTVKSMGEFILAFILFYVATVIVSTALYALIDRPSMNYRAKVLARWKAKEDGLAGQDG